MTADNLDPDIPITRIFKCPDGVSRVVTMPNWYAYHLDWLCEIGEWNLQEKIDWFWEQALLYPDDPETEFRALIPFAIRLAIRSHYPNLVTLAYNDNLGERLAE